MKSRTYTMRARHEAKSATRDAIIAAGVDTFMAEKSFAFTLATVAGRAGVTVKTVLRHFGSREALIDACCSQLHADVMAERAAPSSDPGTALKVLVEHYEARGNAVLSLLAQEHTDTRARTVCEGGRSEHRDWVTAVFAAELPAQSGERARLIDALVVATDVYCWKLLRLDRGLTAAEVCDRMSLMTDGILALAARSVQERGDR